MNTTMNIIEVFRIVLYLPNQPPASFIRVKSMLWNKPIVLVDRFNLH